MPRGTSANNPSTYLQKIIEDKGMVSIRNLTKAKINTAFLKRSAEEMLRKERRLGDVSIVLVQPKKSRELNMRYRGKDYAANVLTFPIPELGLGEIVICPQKVRANAKEYGIKKERAMKLMVFHGVLHLLGYGHGAI
ncbi:MAG: rRNA maturation RNase YbeY, partial [Candidatus Pacearchaeota archaeon]|nr:rRNA maturation RNase YbeY [Candidatus Pacearchaeota archaeon]